MQTSSTPCGTVAVPHPQTGAGVCAGTRIMTLDGEIPVDNLMPGDRIVTRNGGARVLQGIVARQARIAPVTIKAGSLGHSGERDARIAPGTRLHLRDWRARALAGVPVAAIAADRLIDGSFVAQGPAQDMQIYELSFAHDQIIYADGVEIVATAA